MSSIIKAEGGEINQQNFFKELMSLCKRYDVIISPVISSDSYPNIRFSFRDASFISLDDSIDFSCSNSFEREYFNDELDFGETITVFNQDVLENKNN